MSRPNLSWRVAEEESGERLDRYLARRLGKSRHQVQRWIEDGRVSLEKRPAKASAQLRPGELIEVTIPDEPPDPGLRAESGPISVLYEDADLVVLDKPAGLAVHPGAGRTSGTLAHFLLHAYPEMAGVGGRGRPGIVHRLDRNTTGALVVARREQAYLRLAAAFAERTVAKTYVAIVYGTPREPAGSIDLAIGRDPRDRQRMAIRSGGRRALTHYLCRRSSRGLSWLEIGLETGRTHQIRVHLKAIGHPLVGDPVYGEARWHGLERRFRGLLSAFPRPALHAWKLAFTHPESGERLAFQAPLPADLVELWRAVAGEEPPLTSADPVSL